MSEALYFVVRPFQYGIPGKQLDVGQVTPLMGQPNDEKLLRMAYFRKVDGRVRLPECGRCGGKFIDERSLNAHGGLRHAEKSEGQIVDAVERVSALAETMYPLDLEKTAAARGGGRRARA